MGVALVPHHTPPAPAPAPAAVLQHAVTTLRPFPTVSVTIYSTLLDRETAMLVRRLQIIVPQDQL